MFIGLIIFVILVIINLKTILYSAKKINKRTWILLFIILIFFLTLYWFFIPNIHRLGDEYILLEKATHFNQKMHILPHSVDKAALTNPLNLIAIDIFRTAFTFFGYNNMVAIKTNIVFSIFNLFLMFYITYIIFDDELVALLSSLFLGMTCNYIMSATSSYNTIIAVTFLLSSVLLFYLFIKYDKPILNATAILALSLLPLIRIELLIIPIIYLFYWIYLKKGYLKKKYVKYWILNGSLWLIIFSIFIKSYLQILLFNISSFGNYHSFKLENIPGTFSNFFLPLINENPLSYLIIIYLISGIIISILLYQKKKRHWCIFLFSQSSILTVIYMINSYFVYWYLNLILPFLIVFFALPIAYILKRSNNIIKAMMTIFLVIIVIIFINNSIVHATPTKNPEFFLATASPEIVESHVPEGCRVISTYTWILTPGTALDVIEVIDTEEIDMTENDCIYFFDEYCYDDSPPGGPPLIEQCEFWRNDYDLKPVIIIQSSKWKQSATLYRIYTQGTNITETNPKVIDID